MNKNKILLLIFCLLISVIIISGGTYALWTWRNGDSDKTVVNFTASSNFKCSATGDTDLSLNDVTFIPVDSSKCNTSENVLKKKITMNLDNGNKIGVQFNTWLNLDSVGSYLLGNENFKWVLSKEESCTSGVVNSGDFGTVTSSTDKIELFNYTYDNTYTGNYYLYMYLDKKEITIPTEDVATRKLNLSLGGVCTDTPLSYREAILNGGYPQLDDGMIPVVISNNGVVQTIAATDSNWYSYSNKKWANAVLVNSSSRNKYLNTTGVTVNENDILAYYVWVPRYKYKIWSVDEELKNDQEQEIDIVFESTMTGKTLDTHVGGYRTHPAFTFGGHELNGIWVGKFETTGSASAPTIKGNSAPIDGQSLSAQFNISRMFVGNTYGVTSRMDAHLMKNSEWGAVAYLSHSKYGIDGRIRINNNSNGLTGCGASVYNGEANTTCEIAYGSATEYPQSTTGNISGIFDMSGGLLENVSGYSGDGISPWGGSYAGFGSSLASKYYDSYDSSSQNYGIPACSSDIVNGVCYGHALTETLYWYSNDLYSISSDPSSQESVWIARGGYYDEGEAAGPFSIALTDGGAITGVGFRSVISYEG